MSKLFISHSSKDDAFVRELRWTLADLKQDAWIDSRELRAGDPLWPDIQKAIEESSAVAVVVSPNSLQAKWVGKELQHALDLQKQRGKDRFPVFALSLDDTKLGVLEGYFDAEPFYIPVSSAAGGVEAAMNPILVAMGQRLPAELSIPTQPKVEPLEELVLELSDLKFHEQDGVRRASARARLVYEPASQGQREVASEKTWRFIAPIGPIEAGELRWYLEHYAIWPSHYFRDRARKVEANLVEWGRLLHDAALPAAHRENVMKAWSKIDDHADRRFSVQVDVALEDGAPEEDAKAAQEAATVLLGLPWELLYDGDGYLFQGAKPVRVRRRLPNTRTLDVSLVAAPIRVLLVTARPEDEACGYIDHRASALPLVEAMEKLGGLVRIHVLSPPTFDALGKELKRAFDAREPYHVVHFDGHGVYDRRVGLGGLCFEDPQDIEKLEKRRHVTVFTDKLGPLLKDYRIPLVFLEACQTALAEDTSESVASELLQRGVASVVAMSHSVLVETARRFVETFYAALAQGHRVGDAMLDGQRNLKDDTFRGRIFGAGELRFEDWFVPVLFQEKEDPQLFQSTPAPQTQEDLRTILSSRLGDLDEKSPVPATGFIGRSRELLALQRLLRDARYAVVRGQGGEGKTALAAEFARWMVRSQQIRRAAFVSAETHGNERAVVDALGKQIIHGDFSAAGDLEESIQQVERALREQSTLLVVDKLESILLPPYLETPEALSAEAGRELTALLALCARLLQVGDTRLVFTSREALPAPFEAGRHRRELHRLDREDAVKLVERALNADDGAGTGAALDAAHEAIESLVDAVHGHARTLTLLAPSLRNRGVESTRAALVELMTEMEQKFPDSREHSLFASVELSLRRLSPANRERARVLGVFHGAVELDVLAMMMEWEKADVGALAAELVETGLATPNRYNHLTLNPALCPYLGGRMESTERDALTTRWVEAMREHVNILIQESRKNTEVAAMLTTLELSNLFALLDLVRRAEDVEATTRLTVSLYRLLQFSGKPQLLDRIGHEHDAAMAALGKDWNHVHFEAYRVQIDRQLLSGRLREALEGARHLIQRTRAVGGQAYPGADYDLAYSSCLLARVLTALGAAEESLPLGEEVRRISVRDDSLRYKMLLGDSYCASGEALLQLGRYDESRQCYQLALDVDRSLKYPRGQAHDVLKLGIISRCQMRLPEALAQFQSALEGFVTWQEVSMVAKTHQEIGETYRCAGQPKAAEDAYRKSLTISVRLGNVAGQASTLSQLGILYDNDLGRTEDAAAFQRQAADKYVEIRDVAKEGFARSNLASTLRKLRRFDEARQEICRAIECGAEFSHASSPWTSWSIFADIEMDVGNPAAAAEAKRKAITCYLAYRRDGGENHYPDGRISLAVTQRLLVGEPAQAAYLLQQRAAEPDAALLLPFIHALQAIVTGSRDRTLADAAKLNYSMAAEIHFLIETLEKAGRYGRCAGYEEARELASPARN